MNPCENEIKPQHKRRLRHTASVLYIASATPPVPANSNTVQRRGSPPAAGMKLISNLPSAGTTKSVARYYTHNNEQKLTIITHRVSTGYMNLGKLSQQSTLFNFRSHSLRQIHVDRSILQNFSIIDITLHYWVARWSSGQRARPAAARSWVRVRWLRAVVQQPWASCSLHPGPGLTQPSILSGSVNEYRLQLGRYKTGTCDAALCAPCIGYLSAFVVAMSTWGAISSVRPLPLPLHSAVLVWQFQSQLRQTNRQTALSQCSLDFPLCEGWPGLNITWHRAVSLRQHGFLF